MARYIFGMPLSNTGEVLLSWAITKLGVNTALTPRQALIGRVTLASAFANGSKAAASLSKRGPRAFVESTPHLLDAASFARFSCSSSRDWHQLTFGVVAATSSQKSMRAVRRNKSARRADPDLFRAGALPYLARGKPGATVTIRLQVLRDFVLAFVAPRIVLVAEKLSCGSRSSS
jgi:hypothetical protein